MTSASKNPGAAIRPILPVAVPEYAPPMGPWYTCGAMGVRDRAVRHRLRSRAGSRGAAVRPSVRWPVEAASRGQRLFRNVAEVLAEAGSSASDVVRIDQYYTSPDVVDAYHETRREFFKGKIPPSTSNLHRRFARAQQSMEVQVMAAVPDADFSVRHEANAGAYKIHASSGYSPALSAGDFRFVPGQTAEALTRRRTADRSRSATRRMACGRARRSSSKRISSSGGSSSRPWRP